eukprot:4965342-Pleurochrysis_carterae.AAC.1
MPILLEEFQASMADMPLSFMDSGSVHNTVLPKHKDPIQAQADELRAALEGQHPDSTDGTEANPFLWPDRSK